MKKRNIILLVILLLIIGLGAISFYIYSPSQTSTKNQELRRWSCTDENCDNCEQKGGVIFLHSFSRNCEIKAKDSGRICIYNDQCTTWCSYSAHGSYWGTCADFGSTEGYKCSRERGKDVVCGMDVS